MRVIHLGKYYPPAAGGIETFTRTLARTEADLGADVQVVVVNHADRTGRDVTFQTTARTPTATDTDGPVRVHRVGRLANVAKLDVTPGLPRLLTQLLHDPPDVWHLHTPNVSMLFALAAMPRVRPLIITHHSDIIRQRVLKFGLRPFERLVYGRAAAILATSEPYIDGSLLLTRFRDKTVAVPLGMDLTPFREPSAEAVVAAADVRRRHPGPVWACVGRLIYYKGLEVALRALKDVPGTLVVVGTGPMEAEWKQLAVELGVADRVDWRGRAGEAEKIGLLHAATALWFPSTHRSEGYGLSQVEALACGCPVINTAIPFSGVPWVARHEETALTVPVNDAPAFAAAARRLLDEPGLRDRLSAEARRQAVERFDHVVMTRQTLAVYDAITRGLPPTVGSRGEVG